MLNTRKMYFNKILGNILCWIPWEDLFTQHTGKYVTLNTVRTFIYTKYWGIVYAENCGKIYLHKILGNTFCWTLLEDLYTQNIGKYFILNTVKRFIYTKYWEILFVEHCWKIYLHKILGNTFCWKIYWNKILGNTLCWTMWEDLLTQNTGK